MRVVERGEFESPKPPKWHIKHELDADLSTSCIATSSPLVSTKYFFKRWSHGFPPRPNQYGILRVISPLPRLEEVNLNHRSHRSDTLSTNLMPICPHQSCDCSPLVSSKYIVCNIVKADSFHRTNLMVKDIRFISYGCMFVATSLSSPTFTADCT